MLSDSCLPVHSAGQTPEVLGHRQRGSAPECTPLTQTRNQGSRLQKLVHLLIATSMHLATDRAPCAVTADSDTPLVMNAGPADFSPAKFRKRGPPDPGGLPRYAR